MFALFFLHFVPFFFWLVEFCCSRIKTKRKDLFSQQAACKLQAQPLSSYQNPEKNNNNNKTLQNQQSFFGQPGAVVKRWLRTLAFRSSKIWKIVQKSYMRTAKNFSPKNVDFMVWLLYLLKFLFSLHCFPVLEDCAAIDGWHDSAYYFIFYCQINCALISQCTKNGKKYVNLRKCWFSAF